MVRQYTAVSSTSLKESIIHIGSFVPFNIVTGLCCGQAFPIGMNQRTGVLRALGRNVGSLTSHLQFLTEASAALQGCSRNHSTSTWQAV